MCKPWKISGVSRKSKGFEKHSDHVNRVGHDLEEEYEEEYEEEV